MGEWGMLQLEDAHVPRTRHRIVSTPLWVRLTVVPCDHIRP